MTPPLGTTAAAYRAAVLSSSPAGYWPLTDAAGTVTVSEIIGGLSGTVTGGVTFGVDDPWGTNGAAGFLVADDRIYLPHEFFQNILAMSAVTFEFWCRVPQRGGIASPIFTTSKSVSSGNFGNDAPAVIIRGSGGGYRCEYHATGYGATPVGIGGLNNTANGTWRHVAVVVLATNAFIVQDAERGPYVNPTPYNDTLPLLGAALGGSYDVLTSQWLIGDLCHFAFYDRALTLEEIQGHLNARPVTFFDQFTQGLHPLGWWKSGAEDFSGNDYHGTVYDGTAADGPIPGGEGSLDFTGNTGANRNMVAVPSLTADLWLNGDWTISQWLNPTSVNVAAVCWAADPTVRGAELGIRTNYLPVMNFAADSILDTQGSPMNLFNPATGTGSQPIEFWAGPRPLIVNTWQHVVTMYEADTNRLSYYINGELCWRFITHRSPPVVTARFTIGNRDVSSGNTPWRGRIAQTVLIASTLSDTEIANWFRSSQRQIPELVPASGKGPITGGSPIVVRGTGLSQATGLRFDLPDESAQVPISFGDDTNVLAVTPAVENPGIAAVSIVFPEFAYSIGNFSFFVPSIPPPPPPELTPIMGPITGGTPIMVRGTGLSQVIGVRFDLPDGSVQVPVSFGDDTTILAVTPAVKKPGGEAAVFLVFPESAYSVGNFTFFIPPPPPPPPPTEPHDWPDVVIYTDADPTPRTEITAQIPPGAATFTLWRITPNSRTIVRGADKALAASSIVVDYEVPFGTPVSYQVQTFDVMDVPAEIGPSSPPVTLSEVLDVWLSDPLDPTTAVALSVRGGPLPALIQPSWETLTYESSSTVTPIVGSRLSVGAAAVRRAFTADYVILARNPTDATALRNLFDHAFPLLMRPPAQFRFVGDPLYLAPGDIAERTSPTGVSVFTFSASIVRPPASSIIVFPRVWDDVPPEAATWDDLATMYATWNGVARGTPGA